MSRPELAHIADDAIEQIRYDQCHAKWLAALACAIQGELEYGEAMLEARARRAMDLAGLAQYLADDLANYTDCRATELQNQLDAAETLPE
ncbi:hypothetical protein [Pseudomonas sp. PI1]|uniref:hypothetical protein n=1 Tax=Pseudomonas sp. PI1 TaxID=1582493 RepID=UPI0005B83262|nr:hypothetical protein [Pseudomonas sp. PI1]KWR74862.1 hypothetical protein RN02_24665 [Pseudomonas sp. PI1]